MTGRRLLWLLAVTVTLCAPVFAKGAVARDAPDTGTERFSLGLGLGGDAFSLDSFAYGLNLLGEYHVTHFFSAGLRMGAYYDFQSLVTLEPLAFVRLYGLTFGSHRLFIEGRAGEALLLYNGDIYPVFSGGISAGIRFALKDWYIEPAVRAGYPVIIGAALTAGYSPRRKKPAVIPREKDESAAAIPPVALQEETVRPGETPVEKLREDIKLDIVIRFRANITSIDDGEMETLTEIGKRLREYPAQRIRIAGYSTATGSSGAQLSNSLERARGVAEYLIRNGYAESERVDIAGFGAENPLVPNNSPANRARNDRVEVIILKD
jgi:outer membrane protein OmpA-like peptidoglycan-associated protein